MNDDAANDIINTSRSESIPSPTTEKLSYDHADAEELQQELQRTRLELKCAQDRLRELYNLSPVCYVSLTSGGLITHISLSAAELLGGKQAQLFNYPFVRFVREGDSERWNRALLSMRQGVAKQCIEVGLKRMKGGTFNARLDCLGMAGKHDSPTLLVAITDITQSRQMEKCPCLAAIAFEIQEGIIVTDTQKVILQVNPAFTRLTGFSSEEAVGQTPRMLSSGLQDPHFYQRMWQSVEHNGYWQGEIWNRRKNGEFFPECLTISAIPDVNGLVNYYVGSFIDISSRKQTEQHAFNTHQRLEHQVQQKNAELQQIKTELDEINTALKVLVQHHKTDNLDTRDVLEREINHEIVPFLNQLKKSIHDSKQLDTLQILEANLQNLALSYGQSNSIVRIYQELTPKEIQVASMIRQGLSTKHIAAILSTSVETINVHRKNIRKKLGLDNKPVNLRCHLGLLD